MNKTVSELLREIKSTGSSQSDSSPENFIQETKLQIGMAFYLKKIFRNYDLLIHKSKVDESNYIDKKILEKILEPIVKECEEKFKIFWQKYEIGELNGDWQSICIDYLENPIKDALMI